MCTSLQVKHGAAWACCCICCLGLAWAIGLPTLLSHTLTRNPWDAEPGNDLRLLIQDSVFAGLQGDNDAWNGVSGPYTADSRFSHSVLIIGDRNGIQFQGSRGRYTADTVMPMASQTKITTALAIYRLMQRHNGSGLTLNSKPSEHIDSWPSTGNAGAVELRHLLSFTTGFEQIGFVSPGCALDSDSHWAPCLDEIAGYNFEFAPGTSFQYGPWHLFVAAGMAMRAVGLPLDKPSWEQVLRDELGFEPNFGGEYGGGTVPDFSGGIQMSANQWQQLMQKLMFEDLLNPIHFAAFVKDHTWAVTHVVGGDLIEYPATAQSGGWHYAQGHWRACDALCTEEEKKKYSDGTRYTWEEANEKCNFTTGLEGQAGPQPDVHHSFGMFGSYIWMDLTNQYYGIYVQFFDPFEEFINGIIIIIIPSVALCCCACGGCFLSSWRAQKAQGAHSAAAVEQEDPEARD